MADETPLIGGGGGGKDGHHHRGHRICGMCCDSRRGTVSMNVLVVVFAVTHMIARAVMYDDPDFEREVANEENIEVIHRNYVPAMVLDGVTIGVAFAVIYGAQKFNSLLVIAGALWYVAMIVYGTVIASKLNVEDGNDTKWFWLIFVWPVYTLIVLYPTFVFIFEMRRGIMSPHTYARERHSWCCVRKL